MSLTVTQFLVSNNMAILFPLFVRFGSLRRLSLSKNENQDEESKIWRRRKYPNQIAEDDKLWKRIFRIQIMAKVSELMYVYMLLRKL